MNKGEAEAAYAAGHALPNVEWPEDVSADHKKLGMHHCPFFAGTPEYSEYARGLQDAINENTPADLPNLQKEIADAITTGDSHA